MPLFGWKHGLRSWYQYQYQTMIFSVKSAISDVNIGNIMGYDVG